MSAREAAIRDIKNELKAQSKSFISFSTYLNPVMKRIEKEYLKQQEALG